MNGLISTKKSQIRRKELQRYYFVAKRYLPTFRALAKYEVSNFLEEEYGNGFISISVKNAKYCVMYATERNLRMSFHITYSAKLSNDYQYFQKADEAVSWFNLDEDEVIFQNWANKYARVRDYQLEVVRAGKCFLHCCALVNPKADGIMGLSRQLHEYVTTGVNKPTKNSGVHRSNVRKKIQFSGSRSRTF